MLIAAALQAQQPDRSHAPLPDPAPAVNIGTPDSFTLANGLKVFVVENHKLPTVTASLVLKLDPVLEKDKVGYVSMAGSLMRRGTTTRSKAELDEAIDFLGGQVRTGSRSASCSGLQKNFEQIFALMADVVLHPSFPAGELEKIRRQTLSGLASAKDDPESMLSNVAAVVTYGADHPYGEVETEATVKKITVPDIRGYYETYWKPNVAYMALVGDITRDSAEALVRRYFSSWKRGSVPRHTYPLPQKPGKALIALVDRPASVQTNIEIINPVMLKPGEAVNFPAALMNAVLGGGSSGWLFQDLREKYGYTYGAYSSLSVDPVIGAFSASGDVRTAVTDSSLARFMYELNRIRDKTVSPALLDSVKNTVSGNFALSLESPARIAQFAIDVAMYDMPADYYRDYLKSIAAVTPAAVQAAARRFVTPDRIHLVMVGNASEFAGKLAAFGPVQYYDGEGNKVAPPLKKQAPAGMTASAVIKKYLEAVGGEEKLSGIKDVHIMSGAEVMGQTLKMEQKYLLPDHFFMNMSMAGHSVSQTIVNGDSAGMWQMGQPLPVDDKTKAGLKARAQPFPELTYGNGKYDLRLKGIETVDGKAVYALEITDPSGEKHSAYYDTSTGLKLRETSPPRKTPQGEMVQTADLRDYREVEGIKIPYETIVDAGGQKIDIRVQEVKFNSGLQPGDFNP
ncbi:hypothetical protein GCM10023143_03580 [Compostibacter hankyongensis]|uniref:Peptidase M16 C-terminal domain-containing protein n=1 Tax=Compostibacter hankyongensis TaxID=1007089 RepID=A0ABP8FEB3_9BACT